MGKKPITKIRGALESGRLTINALDDGSGVLLDVDGEQLLTLNRTGMRLVQAVDEGASSVEALRDMLLEEFDVEAERAEADARAFVGEVAEALSLGSLVGGLRLGFGSLAPVGGRLRHAARPSCADRRTPCGSPSETEPPNQPRLWDLPASVHRIGVGILKANT